MRRVKKSSSEGAAAWNGAGVTCGLEVVSAEWKVTSDLGVALGEWEVTSALGVASGEPLA